MRSITPMSVGMGMRATVPRAFSGRSDSGRGVATLDARSAAPWRIRPWSVLGCALHGRLGTRVRPRRRVAARSRSPASARPHTRRRRVAPRARSGPRPPNARSPTPGSSPSDIDGLTWSGAFPDFDVAVFHEHFGTDARHVDVAVGRRHGVGRDRAVPRGAGDPRRQGDATCSTCSRSRGRRSAAR